MFKYKILSSRGRTSTSTESVTAAKSASVQTAALSKKQTATIGDLRVWWIPQIPGKPFTVRVKDPEEGMRILEVLASYDMFQLHHRIKPDFSNVGDLQQWDGEDWMDWGEDETGLDIREVATLLEEDGAWIPRRYCWEWKEGTP